MYTIWFRPPGTSGALSVNVEAPSVGYAQEVWDRLKAGGFEMLNTRP